MKRVAEIIGLAPEHAAEYIELHREVWPEILERLTDSQIHNYSIFRRGELLVAYFEYTGQDYDGDMAAVAADPRTRSWWAVVGPLQRPMPDRGDGEWWAHLDEIFHLD